MNSIRDPFSIRNKPTFSPALEILRQQPLLHIARGAAQSISSEVQHTVRNVVTPAVDSAVESAKEAAKEAAQQMSFSIPQTVPSFTSAHRDLENQAWSARFGQRDLPLYKDKPYYSNSATAKRKTMRRKRVVILLAALAFCAYWFGLFSKDGVQLPAASTIMATGRSPVDWDERREKVREVFVESWEAYERDAWGKRPPAHLCPSGLTSALQDLIYTVPFPKPASRWETRRSVGSSSMLSTP